MADLVTISKAGTPAGTKIKDLTPAQQTELLKSILENTPTIDDLTVDQFINAVNKRTENKIVKDLDKLLNIKQIDYESEKEIFINNVSNTKSDATKNGYKYALQELEKYCDLQQIKTPLLLDPATADNWIYYETNTAKTKFNKPLAAATIRRNVAGVSSFFTFLARRYDFIKNPFIGTKARPEKKNKKAAIYPTQKEVEFILDGITNNELKVIAYFMAFRGIRCGGFQNMIISKHETENGEQFKFETTSKGKTQRGTIPAICIDALHNAGIKTTAKQIQPFTSWNADKVKNYFKYYTKKIYRQNELLKLIDTAYSCHDFRHFYALQEYGKNKDIFQLKELLNHSSIATTEIYLRNLGVEI